MVNFLFGNYTPFDGILLLTLLVGVVIYLLAFASKRKHLLATLLSLEGLILIVFGFFYYFRAYLISFQGFLLVFLTLAACEGALGLSLLVLIVRGYGSDHFQSLSFLQC
jgi:NADH-ubiquinone oxidoreductase chain 4L